MVTHLWATTEVGPLLLLVLVQPQTREKFRRIDFGNLYIQISGSNIIKEADATTQIITTFAGIQYEPEDFRQPCSCNTIVI
jgi:hypothetical protein